MEVNAQKVVDITQEEQSKNEAKYLKIGLDAIYLLHCALQGAVPETERVADMELEKVFAFCKWHTVASMAYFALEKMSPLPEGEVMGKWRETRDKALRKNLMLDAERRQLFAFLESHGIWHMPLKGVLLKELYPRQEMRQMADNDILFDAANRSLVKTFFTERKYKIISYGSSNHDEYEKPPIYNFEMHAALFLEAARPAWAAYYENVRERLFPVEGKAFELCFSPEDFYIYFVLHAFKHFDGSGSGIRYFADSYVYRKKVSMNEAYVAAELEKLGIADFEKAFRGVADKLFEEPAEDEPPAEIEHPAEAEAERPTETELSAETFEAEPVDLEMFAFSRAEKELFLLGLGSGTYGTMERSVQNKIRQVMGEGTKHGLYMKLKYLFRWLIPDMEFYRKYFPFTYRHKWMIPFTLVFRVVRGVLVKRKKIAAEWKALWRTK